MRVGKARRQGSQRTPRGAGNNPEKTDTIPTRKSVRGSRRRGLRVDPAGLNFPTPTNTHPRHHKKPHNPNPDEPPAVISAASSPCPARDHRAPWAATDRVS